MTTPTNPTPTVCGTIKALDLSIVLKHAFLSGVVAARNIPAHEECIGPDLWLEYEPYENGPYARILAAIQPASAQPGAVIEGADMKRCCDCASSSTGPEAADGVVAMNACLVQLDMLVAESGRGIDYGEEDAFRMGEWFEDADLANIERAKVFVTDLFRAAPVAGDAVSVQEAIMREVHRFAEEKRWHPSNVTELVARIGKLRALGGETA